MNNCRCQYNEFLSYNSILFLSKRSHDDVLPKMWESIFRLSLFFPFSIRRVDPSGCCCRQRKKKKKNRQAKISESPLDSKSLAPPSLSMDRWTWPTWQFSCVCQPSNERRLELCRQQLLSSIHFSSGISPLCGESSWVGESSKNAVTLSFKESNLLSSLDFGQNLKILRFDLKIIIRKL